LPQWEPILTSTVLGAQASRGFSLIAFAPVAGRLSMTWSGRLLRKPTPHSSQMGTQVLKKVITGLFAALLGTAPSGAQTVNYDGLAFDNAKHRGWYVRFWTGSCAELRNVICLSGTPHWNDITQRLLASVPAERRERLTVRLILLGRSVGYEWAKENDIRRIDNAHIKTWTSDLKSATDPESAVGRIESQSRMLIGGTGDPRPARAAR